RDKVASGLICTQPVPGLPLRDIVLADIDQLIALADLTLGPVEHDPNAVLAIEELNVIEYVALRDVRLGKTEELSVAIDFSLAGGVDRALAIDPDPVIGAIGDASADHEIERGRAPHPVRHTDLRQAVEVKACVMNPPGTELALHCQFDRKLDLRFKQQDRSGG